MNGRFLRFNDEEIERKYFEDEYLRMIQVLKYQVYLGLLFSVILAIMSFIQNEYIIYLTSGGVVLLLPLIIITLAKKYPYQCNSILSANNIGWCVLISTIYLWTKADISKVCAVVSDSSPSCSYLFVVGGGFYTLHLSLLIGTNFLLNISTFIAINSVYVFTILPSIPNILCLIILAPLCVGVASFSREKNARLYYELINKYYIWYHIANNVLPQKFIVTKAAQSQNGYQLVKANRRARKEYSINSNQELQQFIGTIDLKQDTQQVIPMYDDTLNIAGNLDSQISKSLGAISQFSKKSFTSRVSNQPGKQGQQQQPRLISLDLLMRREIRRQNSNDINLVQDKDNVSSHNAGGTLHQNQAGQHLLANGVGGTIMNNTPNLNTSTIDQAAVYMRNQRRSLFQMEDPQLQSIANPSVKSKKSKKSLRRTKLEKYKGVFKSDPEEKRKFLLTLVCYSKDEQFQLIMIEEDNNVEREQVLDEQVSLYKSFSVNFANIMQNESNMLQFYLQQIRQNLQMQKKINECVSDAFHLNSNLTSRINNFIEFYNIESSKIELNPKQLSLKKLIKDIALSVDFRVKQNQTQLIISNECPAEFDNIFNDEKRLRHIITYLLQDCIQNTPKGQIVISTSPGAAEIGDGGQTTLQGTIKINIRDNSARKYHPTRNQDYFFSTANLNRIVKNKQRSYQDIEVSVCKQILKRIGPQANIFYQSEERNTNRVSFYIYTDILSGGDNINLSHTKILQDDDELENRVEDDEEHNLQFQVQNSDDTYKNNNEQSPVQETAQDNNPNNQIVGSNNNPSSIYLFHGVESRQTAQQQSSGILFSSQYQLQGQIPVQGSSSDKYSVNQTHLIQQLQGGQQQSNQMINGLSSQNHSSVGILNANHQTISLSSQSALNTQVDKLYQINQQHAQTLPDRKNGENKQHQPLRKSTSQLFDESDKIEDENPVSEVYIKELSQTSVRFKRDLSRRMSQKPHLFKTSIDELDYNTRLTSMQRASNSNNNYQNGSKHQSSLNSISKSLVSNTIILIIFIPFMSAFFQI